jgi:SAM-dependent methyltransferase
MEALLRSMTTGYSSADIVPGKGTLTLDVEKLSLSDDSIDVVVASHVLEHVDDLLALRELHRVLRSRGRLVLFTPVVESWESTYEDGRITDPRQRELHFGQFDHVRYYGRDLRERMKSAGFALREFRASPAQVVRHGLMRGETAFVCTK